MRRARETGATVLPVDSEHNALFQAMTAGRPVRLTHVLELPPTPGGADAMPQGARRMSVAVGDAAKRFAPDLPVARVVRPWIAPGGSPDSGISEAAPRGRTGNGEAGSDEISAALADAVAVAANDGGAAPLDAKRASAADARTQRTAAVPGAVGAKSSALDARVRRARRRLAVAGCALIALASAAVLLRRPHGGPSAPPSEAPPAAPASVAAAPAAEPPPSPSAPADPPLPAVSSSAVSPTADPADYGRALASGDTLLKRGKYRAAVAQFRKAVELRPDSVPALLALGDAFLEGDQLRNAVKPLQQAAQLDPKNARAQLLLGTVFQGLGREKEAVAAYKRYLELEPHGEFAGDVRAIVANLSK